MRKISSVLSILGVLLLAGTASAADPIVLPQTGVDLPGLIQAMVLALGGVVVAAIAAYFAFMLVKKGLGWAKKVG